MKQAQLRYLPKISRKKRLGNSNSRRKMRLTASDSLHSANRSVPSSVANGTRSLLNLAIQYRSGSSNEFTDSLSHLVARSRSRNNSSVQSRDMNNEDKCDPTADD